MKESKETRSQQLSITTFMYTNAEEAKRVYSGLSETQRLQMVTVYQKAFGGKPWYEKFKCPSCNRYQPNNLCKTCGRGNLPDAYPMDQLIQEELPGMLSSFKPGVLLLVTSSAEEIIGFSTGGVTTLQELIDKKYQRNSQILQDISQKTNLSPSANVFYDNETCILPEYQQFGIGKRLSEERINAATNLGAKIICGRTINIPWLNLKRQQLTAAGFSFISFTPEEDTYVVDNVSRQFYYASDGTRRKNK